MNSVDEPLQTQVSEQFDILSKSLAELEEIVGLLHRRLHPILRDDTDDQLKNEKDSIMLVPLANNIKAHSDHVQRISLNLKNILELLEL
jgi:hypothetical protein